MGTVFNEQMFGLSIEDDWAVYVGTFVAFASSGLLGWVLVEKMRNFSTKADKIWKATLPIFSTPVAIFLAFQLLWGLGYCNKFIADAFTFGAVLGIVVKLYEKPKSTVKLVALVPNGKSVDVWLDSPAVLVGEARNKIAEALHVSPANRVCIESGRGSFIEELSQPLLPIISSDSNNLETDFFGFGTASCYIFVKEEEEKSAEEDGKTSVPHKFSFMGGVLHQRDAKFGDQFILTAKHPSLSTDSKPFFIQLVDRFVGASLTFQSNTPHFVRFVNWTASSNTSSNSNGDAISEAGDALHSPSSKDGPSSAPAPENRTVVRRASIKASEAIAALTQSNQTRIKYPGDGQPIRNGDTILLECDDKFMSLTKGWWMMWSSPVMRRSGAFTVEIVERAASSTLKEQFDQFKDKLKRPSISLGAIGAVGGMEALGAMGALNTARSDKPDSAGPNSAATTGAVSGGGGGTTSGTGTGSGTAAGVIATPNDNILRPGDYFRLRSAKFPEFEMGVTHKKIRDSFCYLGLRNIEDKDSDPWSHPVLFCLKSGNALSMNF